MNRTLITLSAMLVFVLLAVSSVSAAQKWAVLVAGSNTYSNYRHQADVFHAYQILIQKGFPKDRIITFAYDDIADNVRNPFKGQVFNKPTYQDPGKDVYAGVFIDYKGKDVTPTNFLRVLEGNATAMQGIGSGKVLASTAHDNVFLYFSDHGSTGLIAFPSQYLYARDLIPTFAKMQGHYKKFVFYLESCESGSMFLNLPNNTAIYALSAANPTESSWGTYCSPDDVIFGKHIGSCLGDLFSVVFLENYEQADLFQLTLQEQFQIIKTKTTRSHVMQWGDLSYQQDKVSEFLSNKKSSIFQLRSALPRLSALRRPEHPAHGDHSIVDSRMIKVRTLSSIFAREQTEEAQNEFIQEVKSMERFDALFAEFSSHLEVTGNQYDPKNIQFDCLQASINHLESQYGERLSDYALTHVKYITEACEKHSVTEIKARLDSGIKIARNYHSKHQVKQQ